VYTVRITMRDRVNLVNEVTKAVVLKIERRAPVVSNVTVSSASLKFTGKNSTTINYTLSEKAKVMVKIYDSNNILVHTLHNAVAKNSGINSVSWNGKKASGALVPAGTYTYKVTAVDAASKASNEATGTITATS
jgi:flagellar hook assembly protein FlgD